MPAARSRVAQRVILGDTPRQMRHWFLAVVVIWAFTPCAAAAEHAETPAGKRFRRSAWFSVSYQYLFTDALAPASQHGGGLGASYEFHVSPRFLVGLPLAYRGFPGEGGAHQIGYGVTLRHLFADDWASGRKLYPFVDYGLLQQQTFAPGRSGVAISHDTRLGGGVVFGGLGFPAFVGASGHLSRLEFFDVESEWIPYVELNMGGIFAF